MCQYLQYSRAQRSQCLTAEQLAANYDWIRLIQLCYIYGEIQKALVVYLFSHVTREVAVQIPPCCRLLESQIVIRCRGTQVPRAWDRNKLKLERCYQPHRKSSDKADKSKPLLLTRIFLLKSDFELHDSTATESAEAVSLARHGCNIQHPEAICAHHPASTSEPAGRCERIPNR